ncbi:MAG: TMEM165/GDT1 family protein [Candidatus Aminicenantes bacterium]|nr:TMEM165/GDT1 family protein [Candidatus Aminicenantes bacterium]
MKIKLFFTVFATILLAELGDKTQLATLLFSTDTSKSKWVVFFAAALALVTASAVAVLLGNVISKHIDPKYLSWAAGIGFIMIGIWTLLKS